MSKPLIDPHRTFNARCWYCDKQLGRVFTSVRRGDNSYRVHGECRAPAERLVANLDPRKMMAELPG